MYYIPTITPLVVAAIIWKWVYQGDYGLLNYYLIQLGLLKEPILWLGDPNLAMPSVILMSIWGGAGYHMVIYLAGLQAIPGEYYDAAKVDGAIRPTLYRWWTTRRHVNRRVFRFKRPRPGRKSACESGGMPNIADLPPLVIQNHGKG